MNNNKKRIPKNGKKHDNFQNVQKGRYCQRVLTEVQQVIV